MMTAWIEWETQDVPAQEQKRLNAWFETALQEGLEAERIDTPVEIGVTVTNAEEIRKINQEFRETDRATDVLSFPMLEYGEEKAGKTIKKAERDPDTGNVLLGDIVLNYEQALVQANEYGHSVERELAFLLIHSLLHLLGYDHMEEDEDIQMRQHQRDIMERLQKKTDYDLHRD